MLGKKLKDRPPIPKELPGQFFVLEWVKHLDKFIITLDDGEEEHPSYDLGSAIPAVMTRFRLWGQPRLGDRAIDMAKEFGKVQGILKDGRTIALYDNSEFKNPTLSFEKVNTGILPKLGHY